MISLVDINHQIQLIFFSVIRILRSILLENLLIYNIVLLTIVTILYITSMGVIYLVTGNLYLGPINSKL